MDLTSRPEGFILILVPADRVDTSSWLAVIAKLIGYCLVVLAAGVAVQLSLTMVFERFWPQAFEVTLLWSALPILLVAVLANFFCLALFERRPLWDIGLRVGGGQPWNGAWGLLAGALPVALITLIPVAMGMARFVPTGDAAPAVFHVVWVLAMLVLAAAAEELLVRGYFFQLLLRKAGPAVALVVTSVFFAMGHLGNPNVSWFSMVNTFLAGIALGYGLWKTGSLWFPIGTHFAWNLALVLAGVNVSGLDIRLTPIDLHWSLATPLTGGNYGPEGGFLATIGFSLWFPFALYLPLRKRKMALLEMPPEKPREDVVLSLNPETPEAPQKTDEPQT